MPVPCRTSVSLARLALPVVVRFAPFGLTELAQPLPLMPALPHGHAVPEPSPKQYGMPVGPHGVPASLTSNEPVMLAAAANCPSWIVYVCPHAVAKLKVLASACVVQLL